jgi:stage III sporulation protein AF
MSAVIGDLIRNLVVIIFLNALLEMMLPRGEFHRYIRLVTGLIVILMVVGTIAALIGKLPRLEPVVAARTAAADSTAAPGRQSEGVSAAYSRQVLQQCRAALEIMLREEIAASGKWQLVEAVLILEEDYRSSSFGTPLKVDLLVKAAAGKSDRIAPVSIEPVAVGPQESAAENTSGPDLRLPEMEQSLAGLLELSPAQVTVTVCE